MTFLPAPLRRWALRAHRDLEIRDHVLQYLFLEITRRCDLSCLHCGSDCSRAAASPELDADSWLSIVDHMQARYAPFFVITGGEPLVSPDLFRITGHLGRTGARWGMVTNGMALDRAAFERLSSCGMSSMTVSLDGLEESHNALRGSPRAFERAASAIGILGESGLAFRDAVTCARPGTLAELDAIGELLAGSGMNSWRIFRIFPRGRAAGRPELGLGGAETAALLEWIARMRPVYARRGLRLSYGCEGYVGLDLDRRIRDEPFFCKSGINIASILADGRISGCSNNPPGLAQGRLGRDEFADVWEGRFAEFRDRSWMRSGACADCAEWRDCLGSSIHLREPGRPGPAFCYRKDLERGGMARCPAMPGKRDANALWRSPRRGRRRR